MRFIESSRDKYRELLATADLADRPQSDNCARKVKCKSTRERLLKKIVRRKLAGMSWTQAVKDTPFNEHDARQMAVVRGIYDSKAHDKQVAAKRAEIQAHAKQVHARAVELGSIRAALDEHSGITADQYYRERARLGLPSLKQNHNQ